MPTLRSLLGALDVVLPLSAGFASVLLLPPQAVSVSAPATMAAANVVTRRKGCLLPCSRPSDDTEGRPAGADRDRSAQGTLAASDTAARACWRMKHPVTRTG